MGVKKKHVPRYRFAIALLGSLFVLYVFGTIFIGLNSYKTTDRKEVIAEAGLSSFDEYIKSSQLMTYFIHKKNRSEFLNEAALFELQRLCLAHKDDCYDSTNRTIEQLEVFLDSVRKEQTHIDESFLKGKAETEAIKK